MAAESSGVVVAALAANLTIAAFKFVAAGATRSSAMLAEAFHSTADAANQVLLLIGLKRSRRPPDDQYQFGHGRETYFWSFLVALCILGVGGGVSIDQGIVKILHRHQAGSELAHAGWAYAVLGVSLALETGSFIPAAARFRSLKRGRSVRRTLAEIRDPALLTVLFEDLAALLGLMLALAGILLTQLSGDAAYDGAASVLIGLVLTGVALYLGGASRSLLIGRSADAADRAAIAEVVRSHSDVCELVHQRTLELGPEELMAAIKVRFRNQLTTTELERSINEIEAGLRQRLPRLRRIYIEPGFDETAGRAVQEPQRS